jgi:hypothetical protein
MSTFADSYPLECSVNGGQNANAIVLFLILWYWGYYLTRIEGNFDGFYEILGGSRKLIARCSEFRHTMGVGIIWPGSAILHA